MKVHLPTLPMNLMRIFDFQQGVGTRTFLNLLDFEIRGAFLEMPIISFSMNAPLFAQSALMSRRMD